MAGSPKREDRKTVLIGIILALAVILLCVGGYFFVRDSISRAQKNTGMPSAKLAEIMAKEIGRTQESETEVTPAPDPSEVPQQVPAGPVVTVLPETQHNISAEEQQRYNELNYSYVPTSVPTAIPTIVPDVNVSADVNYAENVDTTGYTAAGISYAAATSTISQEGYNNSVDMLFDGDQTTSWQEGNPGAGEGEAIYVSLDKTYNVKYIKFRLGNWRDAASWSENARPASMTILVGGSGIKVNFPDQMSEFIVSFSGEVNTSEISINMDSVYRGTAYEDLCISDMWILGKE